MRSRGSNELSTERFLPKFSSLGFSMGYVFGQYLRNIANILRVISEGFWYFSHFLISVERSRW